MVNFIWQEGQGVVVTVKGPGKIHLLTYGSSVHKSMVGSVAARPDGATRFMISHSYGYTKYAFYWEGAGDAVASCGPDNRISVGKSWKEATFVEWGRSAFAYKDVNADADAAGSNLDIPCFVIPELDK